MPVLLSVSSVGAAQSSLPSSLSLALGDDTDSLRLPTLDSDCISQEFEAAPSRGETSQLSRAESRHSPTRDETSAASSAATSTRPGSSQSIVGGSDAVMVEAPTPDVAE